MPNSYDVINLSELAVPDALVVPDAAEIFSRWLARLQELDPQFDALVESDPAFKQGEVNAYQLTLAFQRVNDAVRAVFLASARGADLDHIGAAFNVKRQVIRPGDPDAVPPSKWNWKMTAHFVNVFSCLGTAKYGGCPQRLPLPCEIGGYRCAGC